MCFYWKHNWPFRQVDSGEMYQNNFVKNDEYSLMNQKEEEMIHFILGMVSWALKLKKK